MRGRKHGKRQLIQRAAVRKAIRRARAFLEVIDAVRGPGYSDDLIQDDRDKSRLKLFERGMRYGINLVERTLEE